MKTKNEEIKQITPSSSEPKFSVEKLRENCIKLFGVSQSTFDGAVYRLKGDYTVCEMKKIIAEWQNKEVK